MRIPIVSGIVDKLQGKPKEQQPDIDIPAPQQPVNLETLLGQSYGEAFWRFQCDNQEVQSKEHMINAIMTSHLSDICKKAYVDVVATYYDRNVILSNLSSGVRWGGEKGGGFGNVADIAFIRLLITKIAVVLTNSYPSDRRKGEFMRFWSLIPDQVWFRISRTTGKDRERIISARITIATESKQKIGQEQSEAR